MRFHALSVAALPLILCGAAMLSAAAPELKCPRNTPILFPDAPEDVYVLDGRAVAPEKVPQLDRSSIESVQIVCHRELYRVFGIEARRSGIVMFTAPGPSTRLKAALDTVATLQRAHFAKHGVFAASVVELGWSDPSALMTIDLVVAADGSRWTATGNHRYRLSERALAVSGGRSRP